MNDTVRKIAPVPNRYNTKLGMWAFLSGEVIFFGSLIATYLFIRFRSPAEFAAAKAHLSIPLIALNTFILILSSYMVVKALEAIRDGNQKGLRNNLAIVTVLGILFVSGQAYEWSTLFRAGESFASVLGTPFFTITGIHGTHVLIGVIWSVFLQLGIRREAYTQKRHQGIENFGLYWHFVDIVWIVLFTLFYLI
jgi:heme/copper-type cytochrome/quinol oxidase subunit 3